MNAGAALRNVRRARNGAQPPSCVFFIHDLPAPAGPAFFRRAAG